MNASNPYEPPATSTEFRSWGRIDFFVIGLWLSIPTIAFLERKLLLPVFEDFEVELPTVTQYLLDFKSPILIAIASATVLLAMFVVPFGPTRRQLLWGACISGAFAGIVYSLAILVPLFTLWRNLS